MQWFITKYFVQKPLISLSIGLFQQWHFYGMTTQTKQTRRTRMSTIKTCWVWIQIWWYQTFLTIYIRIRLARFNFFLLHPDVALSLPYWLSQFKFSMLTVSVASILWEDKKYHHPCVIGLTTSFLNLIFHSLFTVQTQRLETQWMQPDDLPSFPLASFLWSSP